MMGELVNCDKCKSSEPGIMGRVIDREAFL